ncbi:YbdK family carboxylate-amine ligase [Nocardia vinacea]|uniref:Putative glutamate--cysteine ligase 2 n=1 Tax=Nocardia vinacea TaxID=96468 RepID=A0ABZ1YHR7_9NOCA|nr:YbdK family carboxylate-amine ligase [Nocardia vinacea]
MPQRRTVGFEEEFLLLDVGGVPVAGVDAVIDWIHTNLGPDESNRFKPELQRVQIESVSLVHTTMQTLQSDLSAARSKLATAGHDCELLVLPIGYAPICGTPHCGGTEDSRYARIHNRYREMAQTYTACGAHVHVGVDGDDQAVAVVNHLRPWLPTLIAVGANSPFHEGHDSGYSSWRIAELSRFPGSGLPPYARSADDYENRVATLVESGVLIDDHMSFWLARPSDVYPTVEVRAADTAATVDDAVLQAVLTRGLVQTAIAALDAGIEGPHIDQQVGAAAVWSAARHGLTGPAIDTVEEVQVPALKMLGNLIEWIADELEEAGDTAVARRLLTGIEHHGTGAARQRSMARLGLKELVESFRLGNGLSTYELH